MKCAICKYKNDDLKGFATHLQMYHKLKSKEYTLKYIYKNYKGCKICGSETRYSRFSFKKYCKAHSNKAMSEAGQRGGQAQAWNKGKTKNNDERLLKQSLKVKGKNNHFFGKNHSMETKKEISLKKKISETTFNNCSFCFDIMTPYRDYKHKWHYLDVICKVCKKNDKRTMQSLLRGSRCTYCFPVTSSKAEDEIANFIENELGFKIRRNVRDIIPPKELDIFIPSLDIAIEYDGLYWHKEDNTSSVDKQKMCQDKGIKLIQIFSDQWLFKKEICNSIIRNKLNRIHDKISARKCKIEKINVKDANNLLEKWHIDGGTRASVAFCLKYDEEIVSTITFRKPFHKKYNNFIEIARFSSKLNTVVVGGLSKLLKYSKKYFNNVKFMTYVDLRLGDGNGYIKSGFKQIGQTSINYWYTDCVDRFSRFYFRATPEESEAQIAKKNKVYRIYGSGNGIFIM